MNTSEKSWQCSDSAEIYAIDRWSSGYFSISDQGEVVVNAPTSRGEFQVSLKDIAKGLEERGLKMPITLRFENLIDARLNELNLGFKRAIQACHYQNHYRGVFPIKVNQQHQVIQEIARYGEKYHHGFEAGSKAELLIAMGMLNNTESLIICNGYKDEKFIDLGLQARKLGLKCIFVVERPKEMAIILQRSAYWNIDPLIGIRLKLSTKVEGQWAADSGARSLFGLTSTQIVEVIDVLKVADKMACLNLLHFHLGSQVSNIRNIRDGIREACKYYINILNEGADLQYLDLGGGLGVDYDGTGSGNYSVNYTLDEYCNDIVEAIQKSLDPYDIVHPIIVTESGRATVAPMSVLLFNILDVGHFEPGVVEAPAAGAHEMLKLLWDVLQALETKRLQEHYNDVIYYHDQLQEAFCRGQINIRERALGENYFLAILQGISARVPELKYPSAELVGLKEFLADIYYGNFSVFQSLADAWAIGQVFPIMPIHRLDEKPTQQAIIADLTCDCDGKLDNFVVGEGNGKTLALHSMKEGEEYCIGVFLVGAYQETLSDLHNLFGDTNVASLLINNEGRVEYTHELRGDSIASVLDYVEYPPNELYKKFHEFAEIAVRNEKITVKERQQMLKLYSDSLAGYTYFES